MLRRAAAAGRRFARRLSRSARPRLLYVTPSAGWSNDWDAKYITEGAQARGVPAMVVPDALAAEGDLVHFGSTWSLLDHLADLNSRGNAIAATIFHGNRGAEFPDLTRAMDRVLGCAKRIDVFVTSCSLMRDRLNSWGVESSKIRMIPLGVELGLFRPIDPDRRLAMRRSLGISDDALCLASFQKDGSGWDEGLEPKAIKGPDLLVECAARLHREFPNLIVLLTGPARGYVKTELERRGVPYRHDFLADYQDIVSWYQAADLYLVTSREEGGPKAIVEAMACGLPVVTTRVGMAPDVVRDGANGFLVEVDDRDALVSRSRQILGDSALRNSLAAAGIETAKAYDWSTITDRYVDEVYRPLLDRLQ